MFKEVEVTLTVLKRSHFIEVSFHRFIFHGLFIEYGFK